MNEDNPDEITVAYVREGDDMHRLITGSDAFPEDAIEIEYEIEGKQDEHSCDRFLC